MKPYELARAASDVLALGLRQVAIVVPRSVNGRQRMRVLGGRDGVKTLWGEPTTENPDGHAVVYVDAVDLLAWLGAYAGIRVETRP
jgi:hypothetical protein